MKILKQILAAGFALAMAHTANASLISVNGTTVEALDLNGSYSSFLDFYDYNTANRFTSNTGLEQSDSIVMFFAELNNEFGLFTLVSGPIGGRGSASLSIRGSDGSVSFVDDPDESSNPLISWSYDRNRGDGLIYSGLTGDSWILGFEFSNLTNILGLEFLTFEDGIFSEATSALSDNETSYTAIYSSRAVTQVSEPSMLGLTGVFLIALSLLRRKA